MRGKGRGAAFSSHGMLLPTHNVPSLKPEVGYGEKGYSARYGAERGCAASAAITMV